MSTVDLHTLTGAYAVHALPESERVEFERHLAQCEACAREVAELSATAERLALAAAVPPPSALRERVLERIGTVRQDPPARGGHGAAGRAGEERGARGGTVRRRAVWSLALAASVALAAVGGVAVWQHESARDARRQAAQAERQDRQRAQEIARVLAAPDAKSARGEPLHGGGTGAVVVSHRENRAVFVGSGMPRPPRGRDYQLWFQDGHSMRSAGLMDASGHGPDRAVLLRGSVDDASGMGVTVEPEGGSRQPTTKPVALMRLPS